MASIAQFFQKNFYFMLFIVVLTGVSAIFFQDSRIAMWIGFGIAGYSAVANDSIQTLGTFLASNKARKWWVLWLFVGIIMVLTFFAGWYLNDGDVAHGRLARIPEPQEFQFLHLVAPIILLVLTRLSMPVSTTFLLLSVFSDKQTLEGMLVKTFVGYAVALLSSYLVWMLIAKYGPRFTWASWASRINQRWWVVLQWVTTAFLWVAWLMQDIANVAVFLPRALSLTQVTVFALTLFVILGVLFYLKGGTIQKVVTEKTDIVNVRSATMVDFVYALILYVFKYLNNLPMSTTWVFLGLLAGREFALTMYGKSEATYRRSLVLVTKDLVRAGFGLVVSIVLAMCIV